MGLQTIREVSCLRAFGSYAKRAKFSDRGLERKATPIYTQISPKILGILGMHIYKFPQSPQSLKCLEGKWAETKGRIQEGKENGLETARKETTRRFTPEDSTP